MYLFVLINYLWLKQGKLLRYILCFTSCALHWVFLRETPSGLRVQGAGVGQVQRYTQVTISVPAEDRGFDH